MAQTFRRRALKLNLIRSTTICILVVGFSFPVFLQGAERGESDILPDAPARMGRETALVLGWESGNFWGSSFDGTDTVKTYRGSSGINLLTYVFGEGKTVGFFVHDFFGFPNSDTINGIQPKYTNRFGIQLGLLLGPLFRHELNERLSLLYGVGPNFLFTKEVCAQYQYIVPSWPTTEESFSRQVFNVGIGVNIMLRYAISDNTLLFVGCISTYDFLSFVELKSVSSNPALNTSGRVRGFSMFGVRPYVSFGLRI
jgi:hypothetical protein